MILVGVDPGQKGAIAVFGPDGLDIRDLKKCYSVTGNFNGLDPVKFSRLIDSMIPYNPTSVIVYCEESILKSNTGIKTARSVYDSRGVLRSVFSLRNIELRFVAPVTWKRYFGLLKKDKEASIEKILEFHPDYRHLFYKNSRRGGEIALDGRAEACLIALHSWKKEQNKNGNKKSRR